MRSVKVRLQKQLVMHFFANDGKDYERVMNIFSIFINGLYKCRCGSGFTTPIETFGCFNSFRNVKSGRSG